MTFLGVMFRLCIKSARQRTCGWWEISAEGGFAGGDAEYLASCLSSWILVSILMTCKSIIMPKRKWRSPKDCLSLLRLWGQNYHTGWPLGMLTYFSSYQRLRSPRTRCQLAWRLLIASSSLMESSYVSSCRKGWAKSKGLFQTDTNCLMT